MKKYINTIVFSILSLCLFSQSGHLILGGGTIMVASGAPKIVIENTRLQYDIDFFSIGQSEVIFKGDAGFDDITIDGTGFINFYNLTIDKSNHGIKLKKTIYVENDLKFVDGLIDLNGNNINLTSNGKLIDESEDSRIIETDGGLIIKTVNLNAPNKENVGNLGAVITSSENLGSTTISRGHQPQTNGGNEGIKRFFDIHPTINTNLNATLEFHYFEAELNGISENDLTIFRHTGSGWENMGFDKHTPNDNCIGKDNIDHFSKWTVGSIQNPLPVEWLSFNAKVNARETVDLNWQTVLEIDNASFSIEKSRNGHQFFEIGKLNSKGNSSDIQNNYFEDKTPFSGINFYRIKQIDNSALFSYSEIRTVNFIHNDFESVIFPNPSEDYFHINFQLEQSSQIKICITDLLGRHLKTLQPSTLLPAGYYSEYFNLMYFPKGTYLIDFQIDRINKKEKIILN
jgi:hypothetical protein